MDGIRDIISRFRASFPGGGVLLAGDVNAAYAPTDREKGVAAYTPNDRNYHRWTRRLALTPMDLRCGQAGLVRTPSYRPRPGTTNTANRIDDVLIDDGSSMVFSGAGRMAVVVDTELEHESDHHPLVLRIDPAAFSHPRPLPERVQARQIAVPFTKDMALRLGTALEYDMAERILALGAAVALLEVADTDDCDTALMTADSS
jgi:hypothetical protein